MTVVASVMMLDSLDTERQISRQNKNVLYNRKQHNSIAYFNVILVCLSK